MNACAARLKTDSTSALESWIAPQAVDGEGSAMLLLRDGRVIGEGDLGIEAVGEHAFVLMDKRVTDAHVAECKARQFDEKAVIAGHPAGL